MIKDFSNEKISHHIDGDVEYITFKILDKYSDKLTHAFFLKSGGVSKRNI